MLLKRSDGCMLAQNLLDTVWGPTESILRPDR
jgi:hypothetical protein